MAELPVPVLDHRKLRQWRLASGLRPKEVAARLQVSYSHLRSIEDGTRNPSVYVLTRIAAFYGKPIGELFTDDTEDAA